MRKQEATDKELVIDVKRILMVLLRFAWLIIAVGIIAGAVAFAYTTNYVAPKYSSSVMLYVNNKSLSVSGNISISAADLSASQSLIDTYIAILMTRTTMEEVIERAQVDYTASQLKSMVHASKTEGTEVFTVTVTSTDPYEATHIANCISEVLPGRIEGIVDGSSMRIVDSAVVKLGKVSPNVAKNTMYTAFLACVAAAAIVVLISLFDDTIHEESFLTDNYDAPILSRVPNLQRTTERGKYGYGYYKKHGYDEYQKPNTGKGEE